MGIDPGAFSNSLMRGLSVGQGLVVNGQNQQRQDKLDRQRDEDRQFTRQLQEANEARQQELYEIQKAKYEKGEAMEQDLRDIAFMEQALENGSYDTPEFYQAGSRLFDDIVNVGGPEGATKEWVGAIMTKGGFIPRLKITTPDGKSYMSEGTLPDRSPTDEEMMVVPVKDFLMEMGNRKMVAQRLQQEFARTNPKTYLENKQKVAAEKRKSAAELAKEQRTQNFELQKIDRQHQNSLSLEAAKARNKQSTSGKTEPIQLKTGRTVTLDDLRKSYIAAYGKADQYGNIGIGDDAPKFSDWVNQQAVGPVFWEDPAQEAGELLAEEPVEEPKSRISAALQGIDLKEAAANAMPFLRPTLAVIDAAGGKQASAQQKPKKNDQRRPLDDIFK